MTSFKKTLSRVSFVIVFLFISTLPASAQQQEKRFLSRPQWFNMGYGVGGFYISYWNTNVKSIFKPYTEYGHSKGLYLGLYNTADVVAMLNDKFYGEFGVRGTYFFLNLEDKLNFYVKGELAAFNSSKGNDARYFLPRAGAGVRWRFLYLEGGLGPVPLHGGLCWQWNAGKN
ncbi:MAG: hypothetical protein KF862_08070 [Chitinophagaceae bacterium]|nr:hypothetical protein [Chitinophagaceae bacterium]